MANLAMRIEATGGDYTNTPGETAPIYDVLVSVAVSEEQFKEGHADGRPTFVAQQGASLMLREFERNLRDGPDSYTIVPVKSGIYADNPTVSHEIPSVVRKIVDASSPEMATFVGEDAIATVLEELDHQKDKERAAYLANAILIVVNHAQEAPVNEGFSVQS